MAMDKKWMSVASAYPNVYQLEGPDIQSSLDLARPKCPRKAQHDSTSSSTRKKRLGRSRGHSSPGGVGRCRNTESETPMFPTFHLGSTSGNSIWGRYSPGSARGPLAYLVSTHFVNCMRCTLKVRGC